VEARAADAVPTNASPATAASAPKTCAGAWDFIDTNCQLTWYGITVYGTIDAGVGWQSHGAPFDPRSAVSASYLIQKQNRSAMWGAAPNALSQSIIGIKGTEPIGGNTSLVFALDAGFDPSRSPRPFLLAEPAQNSNRARHCEPLRGATSQLTYRCSSLLRLFNLREGPRSSATERDPQSSGTPPAQELETNFDEFSACSDAEAVSGGVVRVSVLVAPQGVLRIVHMTNDRHRDHSDGCADD